MPPDHYLNTRALGITGGSWELGLLSALSYFIYVRFENRKSLILLFYVITLTLIILAEGRANFVAFLVSTIFLLKKFTPTDMKKNSTLKYNHFIILTFVFLFLLIMFFYLKDENFLKEFAFFNRLLTLNLPEIFNMLKVFILHNEAPDIAVITKTKPHLLSFTYIQKCPPHDAQKHSTIRNF